MRPSTSRSWIVSKPKSQPDLVRAVIRTIGFSSFLLLTKTAGTTRNIRTRLFRSSECWRIKQPKLTPGLKKQKYQNRDFEAFTISWLPSDFLTNPNLCVFDGPLSRTIPANNKCPISPGKNFTLEETIKLAVDQKNAVAMWGPYEIKQEAFDLAVKRKKLLDGGTIKYRADDRLYQKDKVAISCFHAMQGLDELFPKGGFLGTGLKMWGFNGTARVLIEYTEKARYRGLLLEPVDVKRDRYGFVYAPTRNGPVPYDPLKSSSAYQR